MTTEQPEYLADLDELALLLDKPTSDPKVAARLRAATRRFRGQVGHPVTQVVDDVVVLDGNGRESILLPVWPVTAVASVVLDGVTLVEGTDYSWSEGGFLRRLCGWWPARLRCLVVTYTHGWLVVPDDVVEAVLDQAQIMDTVRPGVQSMTTGAQSVTFGTQGAVGATETWAKAVTRHRIRTAGDA